MTQGQELIEEIKDATVLATAPDMSKKVYFSPENIDARGTAIGTISEIGQHMASRKEPENIDTAKLILECLRYLRTKDSYYEVLVTWAIKELSKEGYLMEATVKIKMYYGSEVDDALIFDITANVRAKEAHLKIMNLPTSGIFAGKYEKAKS